MLTIEEKYNFIGYKNSKYDGLFYTAVNGFRACKICKPDKISGI